MLMFPMKDFQQPEKVLIESLRPNEEEEDASIKKTVTEAKKACLLCLFCLFHLFVGGVSCHACDSCAEARGSIHGKQINTITYWKTYWAKRTPIYTQSGLSARARKVIQGNG